MTYRLHRKVQSFHVMLKCLQVLMLIVLRVLVEQKRTVNAVWFCLAVNAGAFPTLCYLIQLLMCLIPSYTPQSAINTFSLWYWQLSPVD